MRSRPDEEARVLSAAASVVDGRERVVLAVSGGLDSMVLLDSVAAAHDGPRSSILVATFDHRTGTHGSRASRLVEKRAGELGLRSVTGVAREQCTRESEWREQRWQFLRSVGDSFRAQVATAHTLDDQVETVFIRILREAGPRGLAGLYAESDILRPFLGVSRSDVEAYAKARRVPFVQDPTNLSRAHLRNRVRHDLLPAITRVRPGFASGLLMIGRMSATWRMEMEDAASRIEVTREPNGSIRIARSELAGYDAESLRVLWPALASRAGVIMDRRGTHRLAEFTMRGRTGGSIQLSGGIEVRMSRDHMILGRWNVAQVEIVRSARAFAGSRGEARASLA